ncbi:MAG: lipoprotein [Sulfuricellaceae bacterium]|nr:lipoprotein [Sulfuricellaceae bacterium]
MRVFTQSGNLMRLVLGFLVLLSLALAGCGFKVDLYLPGQCSQQGQAK